LAGPAVSDAGSIDEDVSATLELALEEDIAANLDHYIRLSRQGYFKNADLFFDKHLRKHAGWFPIVWEYFDCQLIANDHVPNGAEFLQDALQAHTYTERETNLIELMLESTFFSKTVQEENSFREQLRDLLSKSEKDDIDVCIVAAAIVILNAKSP